MPDAVTKVISKQEDRTPTHQAYVERKADFGTAVHEAIALHGEDDTPIEDIVQEYGYMVADALARYRVLLATDPVMSTATGIRHELRMTTRYLSGQIDILCDVIAEDGYTHVAIIDIKTGKTDETAVYQLSLYGYIYRQKHGVLPRLYRLQLIPGDAARLEPIQYTSLPRVMEIIATVKEKRESEGK